VIRAICAAAVLLAAAALPSTASAEHAYVANAGSDTLSVIDTAVDQVNGTVRVGSKPVAVALSADGSRAYVANREDGTVTVVDTTTDRTVGSPIKVGESLTGVAVSPDGRLIYVSYETSGVAVIDAQSDELLRKIPILGQCQAIALAPDGRTAYVVTRSGLIALDTTAGTFSEIPDLYGTASAIAMSPNGARLYYSYFDLGVSEGAIATIDTATNEVVAKARGIGGSSLAVGPGGDRLYAAASRAGARVYELPTVREIGPSMEDPEGSAGPIALDPGGSTLFAGTAYGETVDAFDTRTGRLDAAIAVGRKPAAIAVGDPAVQYLEVRVGCPAKAWPFRCVLTARAVSGKRNPRRLSNVSVVELKAARSTIASLLPTPAARARLSGSSSIIVRITRRIGHSSRSFVRRMSTIP
jgi:YVTN family beta-propeller protein